LEIQATVQAQTSLEKAHAGFFYDRKAKCYLPLRSREKMKPMISDYSSQIAEFWPTIMQAWDDHGDKHPIIECDVVGLKVAAMPALEYIDGLTERSREATRREYKKITAQGDMMVFIRDTKNRVLQSYIFNLASTG
jgi:hypothetical protein